MAHPALHSRPSEIVIARRIVQVGGRRRGRRGIVLVFVVVLLTLLAIMGTAYLATSRLDRQAVVGRGRLPGATGSPTLADRATLDALSLKVERQAKVQIIRDLFNIAPSVEFNGDAWKLRAGTGAFRQQISTAVQPTSFYENYDAPGRADAWLASLLPRQVLPATTPRSYVWPWISGPMLDATSRVPLTATSTTQTDFFGEPFFSDPRFAGGTGFPLGARYGVTNPAVAYPGAPATATAENTAVTDRHNVEITSLQMLRSGVTTPTSTSDNTRVYPALISAGTGGSAAIAGDADGDGIADGGLVPIALDPSIPEGNINRYLDAKNGVVYFYSYRIVDNGAKLNVATALDHQADYVELQVNTSTTENADRGLLSGAGTPPLELRELIAEDKASTAYSNLVDPTAPAGVLGPNYGFFRSNVGYLSLLRTLLSPLNQSTDPNDYGRAPAQQEFRRLVDARFPLLRQNPGDQQAGSQGVDDKDLQKLATSFTAPLASIAQFRIGTSANPVPTGPVAYTPAFTSHYLFRSFGDLLEQQVARLPGNAGAYPWTTVNGVPPSLRTDALPWLGIGDTLSFAAKNGTLVSPYLAQGTAEQALIFSTRFAAPNVSGNGEQPWGYFPPDAIDLWFGWTQDFEPNPAPAAGAAAEIPAVDGATPVARAFDYSATNFPTKPTGLADVILARSPRTLLTSHNGVTWLAPRREDLFPSGLTPTPTAADLKTLGLPIGMPAYTPIEARDGLTGRTNTPVAASAIGTDPSLGTNYFVYPAAKVSAATGTKEQLWRAFWSAMTQQRTFEYPVGVTTSISSFWDAARNNVFPVPTAYTPTIYPEPFRSSDRYASNESTVSTAAETSRTYLASTSTPVEQNQPTEVLTSRQMALLRSAIAACNTIDLRDADNDITAMDVDITDNHVATTRYYARVYGTEKQLVISGVYIEAGGTPFVAVEIYNPTDVPIPLSAYRIAVMNRAGAAPFKTTGTINQLATGGVEPIRLSTDAAEMLQPGGYVVLMSLPTPPDAGRFPVPTPSATHPPAAGAVDTYVRTPADVAAIGPTLNALAAGAGTYDLVLARTRRADGIPFVDGTTGGATTVRTEIENEVAVPSTSTAADTNGTTEVQTLVMLDAVDCRLGVAPNTIGGPIPRFSYQRQRPGPKPAPTATAATPLADEPAGRDQAWRCFYAGNFYDLRPAAGARNPATAMPTGVNNLAWREIDDVVPVTFAPVATTGVQYQASPNTPGGFLAPAIPIQNFEPLDPYTVTNRRVTGAATGALQQSVFGGVVPAEWRGIFHLINRFPYGSPFARELDLHAIPYIGTYKIFRQTGAGGPVDLYEFVPLPMDAVAAASNLVDIEANGADQITTFGRPDPKRAIGAAPSGREDEWATTLTDFVTARHAPYKTYFPDVPNVTLETTFANTTSIPSLATQDQRWAQDGPVNGTNATPNPWNDVRFVSFTERNTAATDAALTTSGFRTGLRAGREVTSTATSSALVQGIGNVNTMPQIVMRQYPWVVDPDTGFSLFQGPSAGLEPRPRAIVNALSVDRESYAASAFTLNAASIHQRFGFSSIATINNETLTLADRLDTIYAPGGTALPSPTGEQYARLGMLRPSDRAAPEAYFPARNLNSARVSNLASTRSDAFTVYVTVQAWTYVGGPAQATDTRLVGERRSSFVVDRSRITEKDFDVSNLIVFPIERE